MKLLLDTHIFLWSLLQMERIAPRLADRLEDPENELWLSPISIWETLILVEKGRVELREDPIRWARGALRSTPVKEAPLNHEVAIQSRTVDLPYQDPADRFLAATAMVYDLTLVTADDRLLACKQLSVLPNK